MVGDGEVIHGIQLKLYSAQPRLPYWKPSPEAASDNLLGGVLGWKSY